VHASSPNESLVKRFPTLVLSALLAACASTPRPSAEAGDRSPLLEQAVLAVEDAWLSALVQRDTSTLERLLADEFVLSGSAPALETRAQYLDSARMPDRTLEPLTLDGREVRVYGDTALSLGTAHLRGQWRERKFELHYRYTHVFVHRDGHWRVVAAHLTTLD
jgi:ketosteroid isomerase-like protein